MLRSCRRGQVAWRELGTDHPCRSYARDSHLSSPNNCCGILHGIGRLFPTNPHHSHTMSTQKQVQLAKSLPPRLLRFFQRFPPPALLQQTSAPIPSPTPASVSTTAPSDPNASALETPAQIDGATEVSTSSSETDPTGLPYHNPFLPVKSHLTGRWRGPVYGLRKQAELVKLASANGVIDLLPWTIKKPGEKEKRRIERGLQVKGTGLGQKVKGKLWERTLSSRLAMRQKAMLDMPALIQEWKQKGHGRGWKKWPSGKAKR
ncbi:unnamed protein product [Periconia digitata]|uniref:Large ribosomal subunit protein mL59 domain-containing protein n=1 Tax=Periconia digitata TaxID=1303443 RepID=A0A9W4URN8_9PLEO|nr:unnamed protein product [Periconia digitata]